MDRLDKSLMERLIRAGQSHLYRFWDQLDSAERSLLADQLRSLDLPLLERLVALLRRGEPPGPSPLSPCPVSRPGKGEAEELWDRGLEEIRTAGVALLMVAGGQGTRLGYRGPKGLFPLSLPSGSTLFQLHAEYIRALSARAGSPLPLIVMTSPDNHEATIRGFEEAGFFGLQGVSFMPQPQLPAVDLQGRIILQSRSSLSWSPNGNGGLFEALARSGTLDQLEREGRRWLFVFPVDNALVKVADPIFLGLAAREGADMALKVVWRRDPEEKLGVPCRHEGGVGIIEYSELGEEARHLRGPGGELIYGAGNIAIHLMSLPLVRRQAKELSSLPYHLALKKIPFVDDQGRTILPPRPNGYKFETFMFDVLAMADHPLLHLVDRVEEFAPLKDGSGPFGPQGVREAIYRRSALYLRSAGTDIPLDDQGLPPWPLEVTPQAALRPEDLAGLDNAGLERHRLEDGSILLDRI